MKHYFDNIQPLKPIPTSALSEVNKLNGIKAVIFDVYGTLLVSASGDIGSVNMLNKQAVSAFKQVGIKPRKRIGEVEFGGKVLNAYKQAIASDHFHKKMAGVVYPEVDIVNIWKQVIKALVAEDVIAKQKIDFKSLSIAFEFLTNPVYPMPDMVSSIEGLHRSGLKLGIVSNAQFFTPQLVNYFLKDRQYSASGRVKWFDPSICVYSFKEGIGKPSPDLYRVLIRSLKRHKLQPRNCLYIGNDMLNDIYPAKALGFKTVLYAGDKRSLRLREDLAVVNQCKPDRIIKGLAEINTILGL